MVVKLNPNRIISLQCRECGKEYPLEKLYVCEECFAPLDVRYDYTSIDLSPSVFRDRPPTIWRYRELLPITDNVPIVDLTVGYTPLQKADRLGSILGLSNLYIKNDTVNPTFSFKDRPVAVAVSKALEFKAEAIGCASTGNLAAASAAHAAKAGLPCYVFVPKDTEHNKITQITAYGAHVLAIDGTYDDANRLAMQIADEQNWVFANFNVRPYYVEGSKTLAFEVCEQLAWTLPDHVIVPTGSGALLCAISKGFSELTTLDLVDNTAVKITCAQPQGCAPIVAAFKKGAAEVEPIEFPDTIAKSLAIGDPGDGRNALSRIQQSGGSAEEATDDEIIEAIRLLAQTEGIFTESAGGITIAVLKKLLEGGHIAKDERVVCYVTGNGLKTPQVVEPYLPRPLQLQPTLHAFQSLVHLKEVTVWSK
ncbi:MAG: threonine synthase [Candidatus Bathyarchaeota archaeon]|nr:MAG: threonine synthase [Candidatus Bathyarchaeota archaeon]